MRRLRPRPAVLTAVTAVAALTLAACSSGADDGGDAASPSESASGDAQCEPGALPTLTDGVLTVGAGEPYAPWYVGEQDSGEGFESALIYAVADRLGYAADDVVWETVTFEQIISPAVKPFDVAAYQTSITDERKQAVDFSSPYLTTRQGVIVMEGGPYAGATTLAELDGARIGVTAAQTSLTLAEAAWGEDADISPYSAAGDGMQALQSGTIDAMVMDVDQGVAASTEYFPDSVVIGTLPDEGVVEQYGLVLDLGSELTDCVSQAVDDLEADGTLAELRTTWLKWERHPWFRDPAMTVPDDARPLGRVGSPDAVPAAAWSPSPLALDRAAFRRAQRRRSLLVALVSTVLVVAAVVLVVVNAPGWERAPTAFFDPAMAWESLPAILEGLWLNLRVWVVAGVVGTVLGLGLAVARTSRIPALFPLRAFATVYVDLFRGVPLLLVLLLVGFGLPALRLEWLGRGARSSARSRSS